MIHYHGTPITPGVHLSRLAGRNFCVSYAAPSQVRVCHEVGQSVMLDNGAFTIWRMVQEGKPIPRRLEAASRGDWSGFYGWVAPWLEHRTTWAVIPDVIDGSERDNDALIDEWPFGGRGAPVWHMHESFERLLDLADEFPRVCIGSSGAYAAVRSSSWCRRMDEAMNVLCGNGPAPAWLHMLRGMALSGGPYPFASVDSTDIARNHHLPHKDAVSMAERWDALQTPARWEKREQMSLV